MVYHLTCERGKRPFLTARLGKMRDKFKEGAPLLIDQLWKLMNDQPEQVERKQMTRG